MGARMTGHRGMLSRLQMVRELEIRSLSLRGPAKAGTTCVKSARMVGSRGLLSRLMGFDSQIR